MKFEKKENLREKILNLNQNNLTEFLAEDYPIITLYGNMPYNFTFEGNNFFILGEEETFVSLKDAASYINRKYFEDIPITEDLAYAKFKYQSKKSHDPRPKVLVLDNDYIYNGKGQVVPGQHDILAFNLNYSDKKYKDKRAINEITSFAHMLKKDKKDIYQRIKDFYPEAIKHIRHYKPENMTKLKMKDGWFWKKCSVVDLKGSEKDWDY